MPSHFRSNHYLGSWDESHCPIFSKYFIDLDIIKSSFTLNNDREHAHFILYVSICDTEVKLTCTKSRVPVFPTIMEADRGYYFYLLYIAMA